MLLIFVCMRAGSVAALNCDGSKPSFSENDIVRYEPSGVATFNRVYYKVFFVLPSRLDSDKKCSANEYYWVQKCGVDGTDVTCSSSNLQPILKMSKSDLTCPATLEKKTTVTRTLYRISSQADVDRCEGEVVNVGLRGARECRKTTTEWVWVANNQCQENAQTSYTNLQNCPADRAMRVTGTNFFVNDLADCMYAYYALDPEGDWMPKKMDTHKCQNRGSCAPQIVYKHSVWDNFPAICSLNGLQVLCTKLGTNYQTTLTSADDLSLETHFKEYAKPTVTHCECATMPARVVLAKGGQVTANFMSYWRQLIMTDPTAESLLLEQADRDVGGGIDALAGLFTRHGSWKILVRCVKAADCVPGQFQTCSACSGTKAQCVNRCQNCAKEEYSNADSILCSPRTVCPENSNTFADDIDTHWIPTAYNTFCECKPNFYLSRSAQPYAEDEALKLDYIFESHRGTCAACKTIDQCPNAMSYTLEGCGGEANHICKCARGYYGTDNGPTMDMSNCKACESGNYQEDTGSTDCEECDEQEDKMLSALASVNESACYCTTNYKRAASNANVKCEKCPQQLPSREASLTAICRDCDPGYHFKREILHEKSECKSWKVMNWLMQLTCSDDKLVLDPIQDTFAFNAWRTQQIQINSLWDQWKQKYLAINPTSWDKILLDCRPCDDLHYRLGCGGPVKIISADNIITYQLVVQNHSANATQQVLVLNSQHQLVSSDLQWTCDTSGVVQNVSIVRRGKCEPCRECSHTQQQLEFVQGCAPNFAGTCEPCSKCDSTDDELIMADEYVDHPNGNVHCHKPSKQDCELKPCDKKRKLELLPPLSGFQYKQIIECGLKDVQSWNPDTDRLDNVIMQKRTITGSDRYSSGKELNYCPPDFYVDKKCFDSNIEWTSTCCILCQQAQGTQKKRGDWKRCSGDLDHDTQHYVQRCDNGFFEDENATCRACQTCVG